MAPAPRGRLVVLGRFSFWSDGEEVRVTEQAAAARFGGAYDPGAFYDEMFAADGTPRPQCAALAEQLDALTPDEFEERRQQVAVAFLNQGIGFTVYGQEEALERIFPFDLI